MWCAPIGVTVDRMRLFRRNRPEPEPDPAAQEADGQPGRCPMTVEAAAELLQQVVDAGTLDPGRDGPIRVFVPSHGMVAFTTNGHGRLIPRD